MDFFWLVTDLGLWQSAFNGNLTHDWLNDHQALWSSEATEGSIWRYVGLT